MRIFITGATGFIGRHVLAGLKAGGQDILLLAREPESILISTEKNFRVLPGSLDDLKSLKAPVKDFDPEVVLHLAWQGIPDFSPALCLLNLRQGAEFFDFLTAETRCRKIIAAGSCFEYGAVQGPCAESQTASVNSLFTWAKHSLYQSGALLCRQAKRDFVWFRFFYVYGPGQRKQSLIPTLMDSLLNRTLPRLNHPYNANDFIHVEDVARALNLGVFKEINPGIYNLGSGHSTEVIRVCEIMEQEILGQTELTQQIRRETRSPQSVNFWADGNKVEKALGWRAEIALEDGLRRYIAGVAGPKAVNKIRL